MIERFSRVPRHAVELSLPLVLSACTPAGTDPLPPSPPGSSASPGSAVSTNEIPLRQPPPGWRTSEKGSISFFAPAEVVEHPVQGEDSLVGQYAASRMRIEFDFGWYSDDSFSGHYDGKEARNATIQATVCGELPALRGEWQDGTRAGLPNVMVLYVRAIGSSPVQGKDHRDPPSSLYFTIEFQDLSDQSVARMILDSVRIAVPGRP